MQGYNVRHFGFVTMGEAWHNNHHAFPSSARLGLHAGETDPGWWVLMGAEARRPGVEREDAGDAAAAAESRRARSLNWVVNGRPVQVRGADRPAPLCSLVGGSVPHSARDHFPGLRPHSRTRLVVPGRTSELVRGFQLGPGDGRPPGIRPLLSAPGGMDHRGLGFGGLYVPSRGRCQRARIGRGPGGGAVRADPRDPVSVCGAIIAGRGHAAAARSRHGGNGVADRRGRRGGGHRSDARRRGDRRPGLSGLWRRSVPHFAAGHWGDNRLSRQSQG